MKVATLEKFHLRGVIKILGTQGWEKLGGGGFSFKQGGGGGRMTLDDTMTIFWGGFLEKLKQFSGEGQKWIVY